VSKDSEIRQLSWKLIKSHMPVFETGQCYEVIVRSVDQELFTCEVSPLDNEELTITARLTSAIDTTPETYFQAFPSVGSTVLVQAIKDDPDDLVVHTIREVDEVRFKIGQTLFKSSADGHVFDEGKNGGLTITPELMAQLGKMSARIDTLENAIKNGVPAAGDGGAAFKTSMVSILDDNKEAEDFSKIENDKVKH